MHAIRQSEFGDHNTLVYAELPDPAPGAGQVRIAVRAAGVHLIDTVIRQGVQRGPFPLPELPMTPGREVAGVVDLVGPGVDDSWLGRRVVAHLGQASGGYAELALAPADALHALDDSVSDEAAVAMIGTGRTTAGILATTPVGAGDVVLVTAAAGGIGSLLVQAVRHAGGYVVGVAGGATKTDRVRALGADAAVDYRQPDWPARVRAALGDRELTLAYDGVGGAVGKAALELLGLAGRLSMYGWSSGEPTPLTAMDLYAHGLTVTVPIGPAMLRGGLRPLESYALAEATAGRWVPPVTAFPLKDAADAHRALETRATIGKTVLLP
ncbi:MAG: zinc-binding dehydrogenase [Micromonosporaceae bacterium]